MADFIILGDGYFAVKFPFHMVTEMTLGRAIPSGFMRQVTLNNEQVRFAVETAEEAGTKRADSVEVRRAMPAEVALLEAQVENLRDYVIFKVEPR